jgi:hypothetical protein
MEHLNLKLLSRASFLICALFFAFQASAIDTKRFDAPPLARGEYLAFTKPISFRYGSSPIPVDRRTLIMPSSIQVVTTTVIQENNSTTSPASTGFPLILPQDENATAQTRPMVELFQNIATTAPPVALPLADPFEEVNSLGINSTDELLEVFESSSFKSPRSSMQDLPFVPPYSVAPDNMRISSSATYQRRQR